MSAGSVRPIEKRIRPYRRGTASAARGLYRRFQVGAIRLPIWSSNSGENVKSNRFVPKLNLTSLMPSGLVEIAANCRRSGGENTVNVAWLGFQSSQRQALTGAA